MMTYIFVML